MAYLKGILAGLAALAVCAVILPSIAVLVPTIQYRPRVNPILLAAHWPMGWVFAIVIFVAAFYWEVHRLKPKHR